MGYECGYQSSVALSGSFWECVSVFFIHVYEFSPLEQRLGVVAVAIVAGIVVIAIVDVVYSI